MGLGVHLTGSGLPGLVRFVGCQQPHHEAFQFACGAYDGTFVPMGAHFVVLALIVGRIFWGAHPDRVSGLTEVVAEVGVTGTGQACFLGDVGSGLSHLVDERLRTGVVVGDSEARGHFLSLAVQKSHGIGRAVDIDAHQERTSHDAPPLLWDKMSAPGKGGSQLPMRTTASRAMRPPPWGCAPSLLPRAMAGSEQDACQKYPSG